MIKRAVPMFQHGSLIIPRSGYQLSWHVEAEDPRPDQPDLFARYL